jgi:hypothetical protein
MGHKLEVSDQNSDSSWRFWLGIFMAIATVLLGFIGLWQYETAHGGIPDFLSVLYHSSQFLILHAPHLEHDVEHPIPLALHIGRLLGAFLFFGAAVMTLLKVFRNEIRLLFLRLPGQKGHLIICGLGDLGVRIARDARRQRKTVVAIEKNLVPAVRNLMSKKGVMLIEGDAREPALLRKAHVEHAECIFAACSQDDINVAIASIAGQMITQRPRTSPLKCRLLIEDPLLLHLLSDGSKFHDTDKEKYIVDCKDLHYRESTARHTLRHYPLDFEHIGKDMDITVHLIIVGFGPMGQELALHAAQIGHFANKAEKGKKLHITVVERPQTPSWSAFKKRYPQFIEICETDFKEFDPDDPDFMDKMVGLCPDQDKDHELMTYVFCFDREDQTNLRIGLECSEHHAKAPLDKKITQPIQYLIYQTSRGGYGALFSREGKGAGIDANAHAFGMMEDIFTWDVLFHEAEDAVAQALHKDYCQKFNKDAPWEQLNHGMKDSCRQAADHIPIKLRAIGLHEEPLNSNKKGITGFSEEQVELLAAMEHERWCAERWLAGWKHGERNDENKTHPDLVPWTELPKGEEKKDYAQIKAIPAILKNAGRGIYR